MSPAKPVQADEDFLDVAGAILDGVPIDWSVLGQATPGADRTFLDQLWAVGRIADVHRRAPDTVRTNWGPFAINERLGAGTFGDVVRAFDPSLDRDVALKLLRTPAAGRHVAEGRLLARVRHPNIVTVFGAATHDGVDGIWMEFIKGRTLAQIVSSSGPFAASDAIAIGVDLCRALSTVHGSGLLHGDIKAQNVMRADGGRIVLMDFGTGRIAGEDARAAGLAGTPLYVAPEVLEGARPDPASDVYSLGVMLYYLMTGAFPVEGKTLREIRAAHAAGKPIPIRARRSDVPRRLAAIVDRAIASRAERFQTATALEAALESGTAAAVRRRVTAVAASIVMTAAAVAFGAWRMYVPDVNVEDLIVSATPTVIVATDTSGAERWRHVFPANYNIGFPMFGRRSQIVGGPDGGVFVATSVQTRRTDEVPEGGQVMRFSARGDLQRTFSFDDHVTFNHKEYGPPWAITAFAVEDRAPSHRVAVSAHHYQWSASGVAILDDHLVRRGSYWQWGWIEALYWLSADRLFIGGYDDARVGGMVALLDPANLNGQAPAPEGAPSRCANCGNGTPLRYIVLPPTEINKVTVSRFNRAMVQLMPDRIVARTIEMEQTDTHPAIDVLYEFSKSLELQRASFGGNYWEMHASLEKQGKLTHSRAQCPDRNGPREVLMWTPERGWEHVAVPHPND